MVSFTFIFKQSLFNRIILIFLCLFWLDMNTATAIKIKEPKSKAGATYHSHAAGSYTLVNTTSSAEGSGSGNLVGTVFFYDRLFLDRFSAGLRFSSFLERSMDVTIGTSTVNILETASFWSMDFKAFFKDHMRPGFKPFLGVSYGNYTVKSTLTTTTTGSATTTEDNTAATIPVTVLSGGFDYIFGFGGVRLEAGQVTGSRNDLDSSSTYRASYQYGGSTLGISVYAFF